MLQAELKILGGRHQGKLISLNTKKFLVGREQDCHLRPNSDLVSRHHCVFSVDDYAVRLRDLGSTNGTLVNGENVRGEILLKSGDRVTIGKLELEVNIRQSARLASGTTPPPPTKSSPVLTTSEISTQSEDVDTSYDLAAFTPNAATPADTGSATAPADTAIIGTFPAGYPQAGAPGYPSPSYPQMMPPGYPMPGGYMPPPQYPQFPPAYGQPPGYGAPAYGQPMGYPMGYPQMMPMQQGFPGAAVAAAPAAVAEPEVTEPAPAAAAPMAVRLPNPEETGVKAPAPAAPAPAGTPAPKKEEKPSTTAADIIKQYMNRRS